MNSKRVYDLVVIHKNEIEGITIASSTDEMKIRALKKSIRQAQDFESEYTAIIMEFSVYENGDKICSNV